MTSWPAPAPSMLTSTSARYLAGTCANAAPSTAMWSAAVFDPALPGRFMIARLSSTLEHHAPRGWNPNPPL